MPETTIYSIGHGTRKIEVLINELKTFDIAFLMDIRSKPFSRWNPQYNRERLKSSLEENGITYVYAGDLLGGFPADPDCYDQNGKVVYDLVRKKDFFKKGIERLVTANEKQLRVAVMCSESKPEACHRTKLVGDELLKRNISVRHIISAEEVKSQESVVAERSKGTDLFSDQ